MLGILVLAAGVGSDPAVDAVAYQALGLFAVWPMLVSGVVCLASGIVLGLGSTYGLVSSWWVAIKLVLNVVLVGLVVGALRPAVPEVVAHGQALADGVTPTTDLSFLAFPPAVSLVALTVATVLSVFKPFGRIRSGPRRGSAREASTTVDA